MTSKKFDTPRNWEFKSFQNKEGASIRYGMAEPPGKSRGTIVVTGGYGRHIEFYFEQINNWLDRGYTVYAMDWYGQGGSDRERPDNPRRPSTKDFDHHVEVLHELVNDVVKPVSDKPAFLSSHSKGGNIILRYLHAHEKDPDFVFDGAILGTPLIDLNTYGISRTVFKRAVDALDKAGLADVPLPSIPKILRDFSDAVIGRWSTPRDLEREQIHDYYKNETDELEIGYPTVGWLSAAFRSCDRVLQDNFLNDIETPVLILTSATDSLVSVDAQIHAAEMLPNGKQVVFDGARHGIWYDIDGVQKPMWQSIDNFINNIEGEKYATFLIHVKNRIHRFFDLS